MFKQNFFMFSCYFIYSFLYSNYSKAFGGDIINRVRGMLGISFAFSKNLVNSYLSFQTHSY